MVETQEKSEEKGERDEGAIRQDLKQTMAVDRVLERSGALRHQAEFTACRSASMTTLVSAGSRVGPIGTARLVRAASSVAGSVDRPPNRAIAGCAWTGPADE